MSLLKSLLHKAGLLGPVSRLRSGTWKYLRGGYSPHRFWEGWGEVFPDMAFQKEIHTTQKWLLGKLREYPGMSKLEVGCGFGRNLDFISRSLPETEKLWGADISGKMLARGRKNLPPRCRLACADARMLPYRDRAFDMVFTHGILMHVPPASLSLALREIGRVARSAVVLVEEARWKGTSKPGSVDVNGYTFLHDYADILPRHGFSIDWQGESGGPVNMVYLVCRPPA